MSTLTTDDWRTLAVLLHLVVVLILGGVALAVAPLVVHTAHHHRLVDGLESCSAAIRKVTQTPIVYVLTFQIAVLFSF